MIKLRGKWIDLKLTLVVGFFLLGKASLAQELYQCPCDTADFVIDSRDVLRDHFNIKKLVGNFYSLTKSMTVAEDGIRLRTVDIIQSTYYSVKCNEEIQCYVRHGVQNVYNRQGQLVVQEFFLHGKQLGISIQYDTNNSVRVFSLDTVSLVFHENGLLKRINSIDFFENECGFRIEMDSNGSLITIGEYSQYYTDRIWDDNLVELFFLNNEGDTISTTKLTEENYSEIFNKFGTTSSREYKKVNTWYCRKSESWFYEEY